MAMSPEATILHPLALRIADKNATSAKKRIVNLGYDGEGLTLTPPRPRGANKSDIGGWFAREMGIFLELY